MLQLRDASHLPLVCLCPFWDHSEWWFFGFSVCETNALTPDSLSKQPIPFPPQVGLLEHPTRWFQAQLLEVNDKCQLALLTGGTPLPCHSRLSSATEACSLKAHRAPSTISHSLLVYVFIFPSKQRLIAIFHSGFDLPFLYSCLSQTDSINDQPFNLRCQLVSMDFTGLDQVVAL